MSACFLWQSEHRTLNWEEADFFYMPLYVNLLVWPVFGWADGPWWGGVWGAATAPLRAAQQTAFNAHVLPAHRPFVAT